MLISIAMGLQRDILIGLAIVGVILLMAAVLIGLLFLLTKALGLLLVLAGIFMMRFFPDISEFQPFGMSKLGIVIGVISLIAGIWLIIT